MNGVLEFVDTSDMTVMTPPQEHFMCTDVEWDPTGRYVTTAVSWWGHKVSVRLAVVLRLPVPYLSIVSMGCKINQINTSIVVRSSTQVSMLRVNLDLSGLY